MSETALHIGDCIEVMAGLPDGCVDAVVTDPPYGINFMGKAWDGPAIEEAAQRERESGRQMPPRLTGGHDSPTRKLIPRSGSAYANRAGEAGAYDFSLKGNAAYQQWCAAWAAECLRVLKPGGHLLAFGGTRTYHRLAAGIEDAGFEIRDCIAWMYGSGFPKSLDVSKAIDAANGRKFEDRYALGRHIREHREALGLTRAQVNAWFGYRDGCEHWERQDPAGARVPTLIDWRVLRARLDLSDEFLPLIERLEAEREVIGTRHRRTANAIYGNGSGTNTETLETTPATPDAHTWQGWGTALKPAFEPIVVARKPLQGTVAANVLTHGTGALNVDGCRVEGVPPSVPQPAFGSPTGQVYGFQAGEGRNGEMSSAAGRWPANVVLDEDAAKALDEQTGELHGAGFATPRQEFSGKPQYDGWGNIGSGTGGARIGDSGGASRFFYCAKVSRAERSAGLEGFEAEFAPTMGNGIGGKEHDPETATPKRNVHPTVKPIDLMRWLTRLVTPPGGTILDPFLGSGSTGIAAVLEGFGLIGIERDPDYMRIAEARIRFWAEHGEEGLELVRAREAAENARAEITLAGQLDLFGSEA